MTLVSPMPFAEAIAELAKRKLMPTNMGTAELRTLDKAFRQQAFFSARNSIEGYLDAFKTAVESIINPKEVKRADRVTPENPEGLVTEGLDPASARVELRKVAESFGLPTKAGEPGVITDLASDARINLVIDTNVRLAQGYGFKRQGQTEGALDAFPAWELYRQEARKEERPWLERFRLAGAATGRPLGDGWTVQGGRMIALKNHPIWDELGSSANFDDALDVAYPPFAFGSGMWVEDVGRDEAVGLGILGADEGVSPDLEGFHVMEEAA